MLRQSVFSLNCGMYIKGAFLFLLVALAGSNKANAQAPDFCEAVNAIVYDAPNGFKNIKGRMLGSNVNATMWYSTLQIPGTIGFRIVYSMGLFYEGALVQTTIRDSVKSVYDEYVKKLKSCLVPQGYNLSYAKNFNDGLEGYPKIVFMKDPPEDITIDKLPAHITMEAMYNKDIGKYTVVMFIFQH